MNARTGNVSDRRAVLLVMIVGLLFYIFTLAPTITWGDDATLQLSAVRGELHASAGSHPVWVALGHAFSQLPGQEPAYWINLVSAVAGAATLGLLFLILRIFQLSPWASVAGVVAFAVSHTFWAHAVRTEVYTLALATQAAVVWTALSWFRTGRSRYLAFLGAAMGLAFATHVLVLLFVPALIWLLYTCRQQLDFRRIGMLLIAAALALLPVVFLLMRDAHEYHFNTWETVRWALFTFEGYDFSGSMLQFAPRTLTRDAIEWAAFLIYQFVGGGLLLALLGVATAGRRLPRTLTVFVGLLYIVPTLFAFAYRVGDRYVFFLPGYLAVAIWVGIGASWFEHRVTTRVSSRHLLRIVQGLTLLILVIFPVITYRVTPLIMQTSGLTFRNDRHVPGPNGRYFVLWPPKNGYYDTRQFAETALASAPDNSLLLADPILASPMVYLQQVEKLRPDIEIRFCCWDIDAALSAARQRPVVLADNTPSIYPLEHLQQRYKIAPHGLLYLLQESE